MSLGIYRFRRHQLPVINFPSHIDWPLSHNSRAMTKINLNRPFRYIQKHIINFSDLEQMHLYA